MALVEAIEPGCIIVSYDVSEQAVYVRTRLRETLKAAGLRMTQFSFYVGPYSEALMEELHEIQAKYGHVANMRVLPSHFFSENGPMLDDYEDAFYADWQELSVKLAFIERAYSGDELNEKPKEGGDSRPFTMGELRGRLSACNNLIETLDTSLGKRKNREPEKAAMLTKLEDELRNLTARYDMLSLKVATRASANGGGA